MKIVNIFTVFFIFIMSSSVAEAGIVCVQNIKTGVFEAKNSNDEKANEECRKRGEGMQKTSQQQDITVQKNTSVSNAEVIKNMAPSNVKVAVTKSSPVDEVWEIKAGDSIRETLDAWRKQAGWEMVWAFDGDFTSQASGAFNGSFSNAVRELMNALPASTKLQVELGANKLIYVTKIEN